MLPIRHRAISPQLFRLLPRQDHIFRGPVVHFPAMITGYPRIPERGRGEIAFEDGQPGVV